MAELPSTAATVAALAPVLHWTVLHWVDRSAAKTRWLSAFTNPRDRALARIGLGTMRWGPNRAGCCYRPVVHAPAMIAERRAANDFHRIHEAFTATSVTPIYARAGAGLRVAKEIGRKSESPWCTRTCRVGRFAYPFQAAAVNRRSSGKP